MIRYVYTYIIRDEHRCTQAKIALNFLASVNLMDVVYIYIASCTVYSSNLLHRKCRLIEWKISTIYLASLMHASTAWYVCWVVALSLLVADGCPSVVDSSCSKGSTIVWPETEIGETVTVSCPCGSPRSSLLPALKATRSCGGNYDEGAQWEDAFCGDCQFHDSRLMLCTLSQVSTT